jgi:hypothetical protein
MISYNIIYFITILFSFIGFLTKEKNIRLTIMLIIMYILTLYAGFRIPSGGDWYNYVAIFKNIKSYNEIFMYYAYSKEPLYLLINLLIKEFTNNYFILFFLISLFAIFFNFYSYKKYTKYCFISIIIYMAFFYYFREMGAIRAGLAYAIFLFSLQYVIKKNFIKFLFLNILAIGFHFTAILGIIIYPIYHLIDWNKQKLFIFLLFSIFLSLLHIDLLVIKFFPHINFILLKKIFNYQKDPHLFYSLGLDLTNIKNILISFLFILIYDFLKSKNKYFKLILITYLIGVSFRLIFSDWGVLAARSATLFNSVEVILLTYCLYLLKGNYKVIGIIILIIYSFMLHYYSFNNYEINIFHNYLVENIQ